MSVVMQLGSATQLFADHPETKIAVLDVLAAYEPIQEAPRMRWESTELPDNIIAPFSSDEIKGNLIKAATPPNIALLVPRHMANPRVVAKDGNSTESDRIFVVPAAMFAADIAKLATPGGDLAGVVGHVEHGEHLGSQIAAVQLLRDQLWADEELYHRLTDNPSEFRDEICLDLWLIAAQAIRLNTLGFVRPGPTYVFVLG